MPTLDVTDEEARAIISGLAMQVPLIAKISAQWNEQAQQAAGNGIGKPSVDEQKQKQSEKRQ